MTLLEIRKKLVELSGLYNLVVDYTSGDYTDNGADFFITEGQKWLDRLLETPQAPADHKVSLTAGDYYIEVSSARAVTDVRIEVSNEGTKYLEKLSIGDLKAKYEDDELFSEVDQNEPAHWAIGVTRNIDGSSYTGQSGKRLFILPRADKAYDVYVTGLFFSQALTSDSDENYWSLAEPAVLIQSALYMRESFFRNSQGLNDWRNSIIDYVNGIDMDTVEEDVAQIDQMESAWDFRKHIVRRSYNE